jgi:flagellar biosynthesis GTPase FlhF
LERIDGKEKGETSREIAVPAATGLARALPSNHPGVPQVGSARKRRLAAVMLPAILLGIAGIGAWLALRSPGSPVPTAVSPIRSNDKAGARNEAWWAEAERQRLQSEANRKTEEDNRKVLEEKRKAEEEKRTAEQEQRKAEEAKRMAEEEKHRVAVEEAARAAAKVAAQKAADSADRQVQGASSATDASPEDYRRAAIATAKRTAEQERQANGQADR